MNAYEIRMIQARCAALGFWPGPIDGKMGKRTREALAAATEWQAARSRPFMHPSGITQIRMHWTAGGYVPNKIDREHYHVLIAGSGEAVRCHDDTARLAHTLNANSGAVAVSCCAMAGAVERPFRAGPAPLTTAQVHAMAAQVADWSRRYDIPVSPYSTMTHAEVQPTLGIPQRSKWDYTWLPGMAGPSDPISVGNRIRTIITAALGEP